MFSTQRLEVLEISEILEILQVCQLLTGKIIRNSTQDHCQNGRGEPRGIGDVRDIPDYVWPNTQERQPK